MTGIEKHVLICGGTACTGKAKSIQPELKKQLEKYGLASSVRVMETVYFGLCGKCPLMLIYPDETVYEHVTGGDLEEIVRDHLRDGKPVERLLSKGGFDRSRIRVLGDADFFGKQLRITLRNTGIIDPESIEDYIEVKGYDALGKVLSIMKPDDVIEEIIKSGLRGRGGAGFPTGMKWRITADSEGETKYVICNADEGDPGAFMDRSAIEGDPHSIIEGMIIAGYAIGSSTGYIYIRAEYPLAIKRLKEAIMQAECYGLLGDNILNSGFNFKLDLRLGAGAFVCGEETSLINSIEGRRGMPRPRPPYPSVSGLWDHPTLINNVETWANIPAIILNGSGWFKSIGTETSKGTKVFALAGKVNNTGLVEVPMGTTLRQIIFEIGGGIKDGKAFKAAQTGGPSGGCLPTQYLDTPVDYETLRQAGSIMGSGGLIVMDEDTCMVDVAKFFLGFTEDESCGKCTPCREGTKRLLEILTRITEGEGVPDDIWKLERLCHTIQRASLCGLGQAAPSPVLSTLKNFRAEYEAHINEKRCPAGVCSALLRYFIEPEACVGCTLCAKVCPVSCISGTPKKVHEIDQSRCIRCGQCMAKCRFDAIYKK
ncbi:NADH-quinone oxidoreductase subunit NuoF [uncultured Desulfobulbus sp.]|uniref:NADH-quinone oxidoreductase subunit NuoF n=1 Tax=uncultured Desulfobulbus sp. TaxID=239745 RepID=UPI0029C76DE5|nr:NADH-quinone oxidoreductase subunit NuoF [uncultured Desulfobulbus sp.]